MRKPVLVIAEDHEVVGVGLRHLLDADFEIHGPYADGRTLLEIIEPLQPDLLVLDLSLRGGNGMYLMDRIWQRSPATRIVIYTTYADYDLMEEAKRRGAAGYVGKDAGVAELRRALDEVDDGGTWFSPLIVQPKIRARGAGPHAAAIAKLSSRRQALLALVGEGLTTAEIAERLDMSERTVYWHRYMIRKALDVEADEDLPRIAAVWNQAARKAEAAVPPRGGKRSSG